MDNNNQPIDETVKTQTPEQTPKKNNNILVIALGVACAVLLVLFIMQMSKTSRLSAQIADESVTISELEESNTELKKQVSELKTQVSELEKNNKALSVKADKYDEIASFLKGGYAFNTSQYFNASETIIIMNKNEKNRKFTLTTNWGGGGKLSTESSDSSVAQAYFNEDSWYNSTHLTVYAAKEGTAIITITSSSIKSPVKVLVIVE